MSSAWQLHIRCFTMRQAMYNFCTSDLFKFHSSQPYICIQKVECTLSKVSVTNAEVTYNTIAPLIKITYIAYNVPVINIS